MGTRQSSPSSRELLIQRRVERARVMLLEDALLAGELALASGFAHQSHMARCMRRVLAVTPTGLRAGVG